MLSAAMPGLRAFKAFTVRGSSWYTFPAFMHRVDSFPSLLNCCGIICERPAGHG